MTKLSRFILPVLLLGSLSMPAAAQDEWEHTLIPFYLWASGIEGQSKVGPVSAPVSIEFSDALEHLDAAFTIHYEANKGQWGVLADFYHLGLQPEGALVNGVPAGVDLTNTIYEFGGLYRPGPEGLDILFGLRGTDLNIEAGIGGLPKRTLVDETWLDAFVGIRKKFAFTEKTSFTFRGDIGAGDSNFVWNAGLMLDYKFNNRFSMFGGYRWLDYDYENGSGRNHFAYNVTYEGPAIALRFDW